MSSPKVFLARLVGCNVFDPAGDRVGKVRDVLLINRRSAPPSVLGLIVEIPGRRQVFVPIGRIISIAGGQVITTGMVNLRRFQQRGGEVRAIAELLGRKVDFVDGSGEGVIEDIAIEPSTPGAWEVSQYFVRRPRTGGARFGRGSTGFADWSEIRERSGQSEAQSAERLVATFSDLRAADLAHALLDLPERRMREAAAQLPDERLADALEEMEEADQLRVVAGLSDERTAEVMNRMQPDDAADLLGQLPETRTERLLGLMEPDEAEDVRILLSYEPDTAGGLMTTDPIILSGDATVAEGLAVIRRQELAPALGAAVCVTLPPYETPTGRFLGIVHFQQMLRYAPHERLSSLVVTDVAPVLPTAPAAEVARVLASYNLVSVPVVDTVGRLIGLVTVDDVLDFLLPEDWRNAEPAPGSRPPRNPAP
ncbi:magnesium transporter MgtE N-terminal domain-containing protein [Mycetocola reblochoni]|uniref:Mg/Co/Ni transporter MgtE / CBS domain n=2 Tax=Mycetocola reblochoni TaxID=331618 RepID=A0A1R4J9A9_9MICO|nr:CBS domain-containing protein [Mycetocola reblochoni]RLP70112.1 CBS domain-containing protein [Mycetocola reblochoni]SJN28375.1 Mg/Co/Ni transporter MgtE / CBS domain [Mycetocola reblochoni REB411]